MEDAPAKPLGERHQCTQCGSLLEAGDRFCRTCGLEQSTNTATIVALVARILPDRIDAALKQRIREQKVVEVETAELLAERAMKWLKALGFFLGIPVVLAVAIFSFFGIKAWSDLQSVASKTLDLQRSLTEPQQRLGQATQQIAKLQADLDEAQKSLSMKILEVGKRQDSLEEQLKIVRGRLGFCPGAEVSAALKEKLEDALSRFIIWLQGIGFDKLDDKIAVCVYSKDAPLPADLRSMGDQPNSMYWNNTLYIHKDMSEDVSVALREYSHHALTKTAAPDAFEQTEIESAVADYLPASFLGSPIIGPTLGRLFGLKTAYIRTLDNALSYKATSGPDWYARGQVWGGALWACRQQGQAQLDRVILPAWRAASAGQTAKAESIRRFAATLVAAPAPVGPCLSNEIARRDLPR
jgi:hypothetical protein